MDSLNEEWIAVSDHTEILNRLLLGLKQDTDLLVDFIAETGFDEFGDEIPEEGADFTSDDGFNEGIALLVLLLWRGEIPLAVWLVSMAFVLRVGITAAWNQGAAVCGILPSELTGAELKARDEFVATQTGFLLGFGEAIALGSRALGLPLAPMLVRAQMWSNRFGDARSASSQLACRDQKLIWIWNPLKEHCTDCRNYNGRVHRARIWEKYNIRPRMGELECGGFRCGCSFQPTNEAGSPGRPPSPSGA